MSESPKPSAPAGDYQLLPLFPNRMFFDAKDYEPKQVRAKVAAARARSISNLHQLKDQMGVGIAHLRIADEVGQVSGSMDVLVGVTNAFQKELQALARLMDNAEARFDDTNPVNDEASGNPATAKGGVVSPRFSAGPVIAGKIQISVDGVPDLGPEALAQAVASQVGDLGFGRISRPAGRGGW